MQAPCSLVQSRSLSLTLQRVVFTCFRCVLHTLARVSTLRTTQCTAFSQCTQLRSFTMVYYVMRARDSYCSSFLTLVYAIFLSISLPHARTTPECTLYMHTDGRFCLLLQFESVHVANLHVHT